MTKKTTRNQGLTPDGIRAQRTQKRKDDANMTPDEANAAQAAKRRSDQRQQTLAMLTKAFKDKLSISYGIRITLEAQLSQPQTSEYRVIRFVAASRIVDISGSHDSGETHITFNNGECYLLEVLVNPGTVRIADRLDDY
jgi:hypothetical protein